MLPPPPPSTLFPYTTLFRSPCGPRPDVCAADRALRRILDSRRGQRCRRPALSHRGIKNPAKGSIGDRKSTRLNSSHRTISYAVFCLKKKKKQTTYSS